MPYGPAWTSNICAWLELTDPGFDFSVLSEFRTRLIEHQAEHRLFELLVEKLSEQGYLKKRGSQRTDSTHVLAAVHRYHRVELLPETLRAALNELAEQAPEWLQQWVPVDWFKRYERRIEESRLAIKKEEQEAFLEQVGRDGSQLLSMLYQDETPPLLAYLPQVQILRQIWVQHFFWEEGQLRLRNKDILPPAHLTLRSPYDPQAHIGRKGGFSWYGYKVHLSETCDPEYPHLITCVQTTDATASDMKQTQVVHEDLSRRHLLPQTHLVDAGYVDAGLIVESRERYGVELLGPVSRNNQWQARSLEKAMICQDLRWILRQKRPRAHKATRVSIGRAYVISMDIPSSTFALTRKRVASALAVPCVLVLKRNPGVCLFVLKRNFFSFNADVSSKKQRNFR